MGGILARPLLSVTKNVFQQDNLRGMRSGATWG